MTLLATILTSLALAAPATPPATPPVAGVADYQLGGAYTSAADVQIVTRDRRDEPAEGLYSICYVNAFQTQPGTLGWWKKNHRSLLLRDRKGHLVRDAGWPDEVLLDLRTKERRAEAAAVVKIWFNRCADAGFQAVEPDNLDSWTRSHGRLTSRQTVLFARRIVAHAHDAGLAIAQKNTPQLSRRGIGFDFVVAEECQVYRECGTYRKSYGQRLIEIEYTDNGRKAYASACKIRGGDVTVLLRDRNLVPRGKKGYVFRHC